MKNTIPQIIAAVGSFLSLVAVAPAELQDQIPQVFPEHYRGLIALGLALTSFLARTYAARQSGRAQAELVQASNVDFRW